jgi:hypothetical protein
VGFLVIVIIQQMAYHEMKSALPGVGWPLAQFFALQFLFGLGVEVAVGYVCRSSIGHDWRAVKRETTE